MVDTGVRDVARSAADFRRLWAGESISLLGTEITALALPLLAVVTLHATPGQLGLLGAATYAPFLLLGLPAGLWIDRKRRRPILIAADLGQAASVAVIPLLAALGQLRMGGLLAAAFAAGSFRVFFELAYQAYLPAIVPPAALTVANSRLTASQSVAEIGGPGLAGLLVQVVGAPSALLADAGSFLASVAGLSAIRQTEQQPPRDPARLRSQIAQGFSVTFGNRYLRAFAGEAASYNLCWQVVQTVLVLFVIQRLHVSPTGLGLILGLGAVGGLLGAVVTAPVAERVGLGRTLIAAAVVGDVAPLILPLLSPGLWAPPLLAASFFVRGLGVTACNVHVNAIRQTITPSQLLGRTNAAYRLLVYGFVPVGALLGGWLGSSLGVRTTLAIATVALLSTSLFLACSPVRQVRRLEDCPPL